MAHCCRAAIFAPEIRVEAGGTPALSEAPLSDAPLCDAGLAPAAGVHGIRLRSGASAAIAQAIVPRLPSPDPFMPAVVAEQQAMTASPHGKAADSTYIAHEVGIHQAVIDWAGQPANQPTNAAYGKYLSGAGPVLQNHLKEAQAAAKKLARGRR